MSNNETRVQIWSKWEGREPYLYGEYESLKEASEVITNFIYGTNYEHEYIVKIITI